jgi:hypothetical protein
MVGCLEDAQLIGKWDHNYPLPDGWGIVGYGLERAVYISPDNIVYKVDDGSGANSTEYFNICQIKLTNPVKNWRVPEATLYQLDNLNSVIAMEYIDGDKAKECRSTYSFKSMCNCNEFPCVAIEWEMVGEIWGIRDLHDDNVMQLPDGTKVLVDVTR